MKVAVRVALAILLLLVVACGSVAGLKPGRTVGIGPSTNIARLTQVAGTAGTVTVAAGCYITSCAALATATNATMTVTPCGPNVTASCTAQPAISIPTTNPISFAPPADTTTNLGTVADKSTVVFANSSNYWCNVYQYSP